MTNNRYSVPILVSYDQNGPNFGLNMVSKYAYNKEKGYYISRMTRGEQILGAMSESIDFLDLALFHRRQLSR